MKKVIVVFLLFMTAAAAAFAAEDGVKVAYRDNALRLPEGGSVVPPVVTEKYEFYEIKGNREKELHRELCKNGCSWRDGKKYDSLTTWHVKWDYGHDRGPQACAADSFRVTVEILFRYPKWARPSDAPEVLAEKWDRYMESLTVHENGHRDLVVQAAAELSRTMAELPPAATCAELDRNIRALCHTRLGKLKEDEKAYDETTRHGVTQGAVFP
jgi:predicted secreted Zn-dependent protease